MQGSVSLPTLELSTETRVGLLRRGDAPKFLFYCAAVAVQRSDPVVAPRAFAARYYFRVYLENSVSSLPPRGASLLREVIGVVEANDELAHVPACGLARWSRRRSRTRGSDVGPPRPAPYPGLISLGAVVRHHDPRSVGVLHPDHSWWRRRPSLHQRRSAGPSE